MPSEGEKPKDSPETPQTGQETGIPSNSPPMVKAPPEGDRKPHAPRTRVQIEDIKGKLQVGVLEGYTPRELSRQLGIPLSTLYNYLSELAEETHERRLKKGNVLVHNYFTREEQILSELRIKWRETGDSKCLAEANRVNNDMFDRLQSAGFIVRRKEEVEHSGAQEYKFIIVEGDGGSPGSDGKDATAPLGKMVQNGKIKGDKTGEK